MNKYLLIILTLVFISCGGETKQTTNKSSESNTILEKDNQTKPEEGGYGFEKIAQDMGFETYNWDEKVDKTFFGDPKAKKGGTLNYIHSLFPRTMRVIGQNSGQVLNSRTIMAMCYEGLEHAEDQDHPWQPIPHDKQNKPRHKRQ